MTVTRDVLDTIMHRRSSANPGSDLFGTIDSYAQTPAEIAAGVTPVNYAFSAVQYDVRRFGAKGDGIADDRQAIQNAITVAQQAGGSVYIPSGNYLIRRIAGLDSQFNGLVIPYTNVFGYQQQVVIHGDAQGTVLKAGDNGMTVIRWSNSNCRLQNIALDANSKTSVTGLSLISSNTASATVAEHIDWNTFIGISINGFTEGIELESPSLGGCYYNRFFGLRLYNNTRHIRFRDNATSGGANRNWFQGSCVGGNAGVYIDGADTNVLQLAFEGVATGTSPLAVPTAVWINTAGSLRGLLSEDTNLIGCIFEGCTQDLDCSNNRTYIIGGNCGTVGAVVGSATPNLFLGGDHQFWLREALIGGPSADSLLLDNRAAGFNTSNPQIVTTANASGSYPFQNDGSIVIQSRQASTSGVLLAAGPTSVIGLQITGDGHAAVLQADVSFPQSASSNAIASNGTITTANLVMARVNPAGARTGIILQAGTQPSQMCVVVNENSSNSITFDISATSHVAQGSAVVIAGLASRTFFWDSVQSLWF